MVVVKCMWLMMRCVCFGAKLYEVYLQCSVHELHEDVFDQM